MPALSKARMGALAQGATALMLAGDHSELPTRLMRAAVRVEPRHHVQVIDAFMADTCAAVAMACHRDFRHTNQLLWHAAVAMSGQVLEEQWRRHLRASELRNVEELDAPQEIAAEMRGVFDRGGRPHSVDLIPVILQLVEPRLLRCVLNALWGRQCLQCGRVHRQFRLCGGCRQARYCSRHCQKAHWLREHRRQCRVV